MRNNPFFLLAALIILVSCKKSMPVNNSGGSNNSGTVDTSKGNNGTGGNVSVGSGTSSGSYNGPCSISSNCEIYWVCLDVPGATALYTCSNNFYQSYGASAASENKVYFAGGSDDFTPYGGSYSDGIEYDPLNNSFRNFTLSVARSFLGGASAGHKILFAGGEETSQYLSIPEYYNTIDIYDEQTLIRTSASLSEARSHLAAVSSGNLAFFIGGKTKNGYSDKMDVYNSETNSWKVITLPRERGFAGAAVIGSNIYIAGGKNNSGNVRTIDIYNILTGLWSSIDAPNDHPFASVASVNDKLIIAGGDGLNNKNADIFNTTTEQWSTVQLSSSRFNMTVASANNKVVFLGGAYSFSGRYFSTEAGEVDVYNDNVGNWFSSSISSISGMMAATIGTKIIYAGFMGNNGTTTTNTMAILNL